MDAVTLKDVSRTYRMDAVNVSALQDVSAQIRPNCFTVISGASGSGKTTLLNLIGCIDRPDRGELIVAGQRVNDLSDDELSDFRREHIGFVFQNFNLLPVLSALENVEYPLVLAGLPARRRKERAMHLLQAVGLAGKAAHRPGQLSGGQRQRVAIARALAGDPRLVLADEPTANLDSRNGDEIIALMRRMQREHGVSFVFSSHDPRVLEEADDILRIVDGRVVEVQRTHAAGKELA